jgi:phage recombination protein Bet
MSNENQTKAVDKLKWEYTPFGSTDKLSLTVNMIRNYIAKPTKQGHYPSDRDCIKFAMLCRGKRANPFEGDCYMVGYDSKDGPVFAMTPGQDLFSKRAEQNEQYDGYEAGVVVLDKTTKEIRHREGSLVLDDETLLGGWCKVFRKDRARPFNKEVKLSTYNKQNDFWLRDPAGMIVKVAYSQGHRTAFPTALGGFYAPEEMGDTGNLLTSVADPAPIEMPTIVDPPEPTPTPKSEAKSEAKREREPRQPRQRDKQKKESAAPAKEAVDPERQALLDSVMEACQRLSGDDLAAAVADPIIHKIATELKLDVDVEWWPDDALKLLLDAVNEALEQEVTT